MSLKVQNTGPYFTNTYWEFLLGLGNLWWGLEICICIWARTWGSSYAWQSLKMSSLKTVKHKSQKYDCLGYPSTIIMISLSSYAWLRVFSCFFYAFMVLHSYFFFLNAHSYLFNWLILICSVRGSWNKSSSMKPSLTSHLPQGIILTPLGAPITLNKYYHYSEKEFKLK